MFNGQIIKLTKMGATKTTFQSPLNSKPYPTNRNFFMPGPNPPACLLVA